MNHARKGTKELEIGGQTLEVDYTYTQGDPGQTSGPPERCWPEESADLEVEAIRLIGWVTDDLGLGSPPRKVMFDVTDLLAEWEQDGGLDGLEVTMLDQGDWDDREED